MVLHRSLFRFSTVLFNSSFCTFLGVTTLNYKRVIEEREMVCFAFFRSQSRPNLLYISCIHEASLPNLNFALQSLWSIVGICGPFRYASSLLQDAHPAGSALFRLASIENGSGHRGWS